MSSSIVAGSTAARKGGFLSSIVRALVARLPPQEAAALFRAQVPASEIVNSEQQIIEHKEINAQLSAKLQSMESKLASIQTESKAKSHQLADLMVQLNEKESSLSKLTREAKAASMQATALPEVQDKEIEQHPVYGRLLHDFGYKKVYSTPATKLCAKETLPVWEEQRLFRPERAVEIANAKKKDMQFGLPGVICIFEQSDQNKRGIIDGQHRVAGIEHLIKSNDWDPTKEILLEVFPISQSEDAKKLFKEINQAQPVRTLDMPGAIGKEQKMAIDQSCIALQERYPQMFSTSLRCRSPRVNIDVLRENVFDSPFARMHMNSTEELLDWMERCNETLGKKPKKFWNEMESKTRHRLTKALPKAKESEFFLGMTKVWLEEDVLK